jgi:hypothetical protein
MKFQPLRNTSDIQIDLHACEWGEHMVVLQADGTMTGRRHNNAQDAADFFRERR